MFGFFAPPPQQHPPLGELHWKRGHWRGRLPLPGHDPVELVIAGTRKGPDTGALAEAATVPARLLEWRTRIAQALYEHAEPYAAADAGIDEDAHTAVHDPDAAWAHAALHAVVVAPIGGVQTVELCYSVPWDGEHLLGARFRGGRWLELNGSTLVP